MATTHFLPFWGEDPDSFQSDPPNADVSLIEDGNLRQIVVELSDPELSGNDLSYGVRLIGGDMPESGGAVSVFIDVIGRPLTPVSFAGADRRALRRAAIY